MARTGSIPPWRKSSKSLKASKTGKKYAIATPFGRKIINTDGSWQMESDASPDKLRAGESKDSLEEDTVACDRSVLVPRPPVACMARGQQGIYGWWRKSSSAKVLGNLKECMQSFAQHCLQSVQTPHTATLQMLSLSDGNMNESECVPTSVLLAHAFASLDISALPSGLERIKIFGADVANPIERTGSQTYSWMPPWLELQHIRLDNTKCIKSQLLKSGLCPHSAKFDIVFMRQGLCYCEDHSKACKPPEELFLNGIKGDDVSDSPSGKYLLESNFRNERPSYRKGKFVLHWRPGRSDWAVAEDNETGYVWANICRDTGNPAMAHASWFVWNGEDFVIDEGVSCTLAGVSPWKRSPHDCKCCAGISLDAVDMQRFMGRVAAILNGRNPGAFALLHGGHYMGVSDEVEEFYVEVERAAERFNSRRSCVSASVLRRMESQDTKEDPTRYWNQIDGLLLSASHA